MQLYSSHSLPRILSLEPPSWGLERVEGKRHQNRRQHCVGSPSLFPGRELEFCFRLASDNLLQNLEKEANPVDSEVCVLVCPVTVDNFILFSK